MKNYLIEFLDEILKDQATRMALPFIVFVAFFGVLILIIQRVKKSKMNIADYIVSFLVTTLAYFTFILVNDLKRIDYVFDIFKYIEGPLKELAVLVRGWNIFDSSTISFFRIMTFEIYQARRRTYSLSKVAITSICLNIYFFSKDIHVTLVRFINDFKEVFTYKTKSIHLENCIFRC